MKCLLQGSAIRWLESVLEERFGHSFQVEKRGFGYAPVIKLYGHPGRIDFGYAEAAFYQSGKPVPEFTCQWWAVPDGFKSVLGEDTLPAPCSLLPAPCSLLPAPLQSPSCCS